MASRRKAPKPGPKKGRRGRPRRTTATAALSPSAAADGVRARMAEAETNAAGTAATALSGHYIRDRFERWAAAFGVDLDALSDHDGDGWRHLAPSVVLTYVAQIARPGVITREWLKETVTALGAELLAGRVVVPGFTDKTLPEIAAAVEALASHLEAEDPRPAAPVLAHQLVEIAEVIEEQSAYDVWTAALQTWQALSWTFGGRAVETTTRLRWQDFAEHGRVDSLVWPAGCKFQVEDITMRRDRTDTLPEALDIRRLLRKLKTALAEAGHAPAPSDAIFPLVNLNTGAITLNPVTRRLADASYHSDKNDSARRGRAERSVTQQYRRSWSKAAEQTSLARNLGHRRLAPHGLRRALATILAALGEGDLRIQHEMRHGKLTTTLRYVDGRSLPVADAYALIEDLDAGREPMDPHGLLESARRFAHACDDEPHHTALPLLAWDEGCDASGCWRKSTGELWSLLSEDGWRVLCTGHVHAYRSGAADWEGPLEVCDESRPEYPCKPGPLTNIPDRRSGEVLRVCASCAGRFYKARGIGATELWRERRALRIASGAPCSAPCDRVHGPGSGFQHVEVDGKRLVFCPGHAVLAKRKPDGWNRPLQKKSPPIDGFITCARPGCDRSKNRGSEMARVNGTVYCKSHWSTAKLHAARE